MGVALNPNAHYAHAPGSPLALPVTLCGWVRLDADRNDFTTICVVCPADDLGNDVLLFALNSDGVTPVIYDEGFAGDINGTAMTLGTWYFVAVTAATGAGNYRFYQVAEGGTLALTDSSTFTGGVLTGEQVGIGGGRPDGEDIALNADASFAYWRFWTAALTLTELQAEMASATPVRTSGLWASYRFENTSNATTDGSGGGHTLTAETGTGSFANTSDPDLGGTDVTGTGALSGGGTIAAAGTRGVAGVTALAGGGSLAAVGQVGVVGAAGLAGGGSLAGLGTRGVAGATAAGAGGALASAGVRGVEGLAAAAAGGALAARGVRGVAGAAEQVAGGTVDTAGVRGVAGVGSLAGGAALAATGTVEGVVSGSGALIGGGVLTGQATRGVNGAGLASGGGVLSGAGQRGVIGAVALSGGGLLAAVSSAQPDPNPTIVRVREARQALADRPIQRLREPA